jgi:hypothetical protein
MCWVCHEREQSSSYRACDGCSNLVDNQEMIVYDLYREWGQLAEFIEQKQRVMLFCSNCRDAMNTYRESMRQHVAELEPSVWHHYGNRYMDKKEAIPVGIHCVNTEMTYGLRCAKQVYGYDATEEILQGFCYWDGKGHRIKRLTLEDVGEKVICDKCWLPLYECNAREVSR